MIQRYRQIFHNSNTDNLASKNRGPILYWMSRDQRINDNPALLFALEKAKENNLPLVIVFNVVTNFLNAPIRHFSFMIDGLKELEKTSIELGLSFYILYGDCVINISEFIKQHNVSLLVTDFSPLNIAKKWKDEVIKKTQIETYEVDAHNIFPVWQISDHQEYMARTLRIKIEKNLEKYLEPFPVLNKDIFASLPKYKKDLKKTNWLEIINSLHADKNVKAIDWIKSGEKEAQKVFGDFLKNKLAHYSSLKNQPEKNVLSNLSPYLHFGQISAQKIAYEIRKNFEPTESTKSFLEELIVRKELSDNYCFYNSNYDNPKGYPNWAVASLEKHLDDKRDYLYSLEEFEKGLTHDELWNAAQKEMVIKGKMHGYMRMYWGKKILEWTKNYHEAHQIAVYLNDKYSIDGRDPNGYVGVAWSLGGLHDRPWPERKIFGLVRFMSFESLKKKIDVKKYISEFYAFLL